MNNRGFTLIEMLLAVLVFAMVGMAAVAVLDSVNRSNQGSVQGIERLQKLQRLMLVLDRDFWQIVPRQVRLNGEAPLAQTLAGGKNFIESDDDGISFVQGGWTNPGMVLPRSEVQLVGYRLKEKQLQRLFYVYPDAVTGTEPTVQVLLDEIDSLEIRYLASDEDEGNSWREHWESSQWPQAVKLTLESAEFGTIERVYLLPQGASHE